MESNIEYPISGSEAAKLAWEIQDCSLAELIDPNTPESFYTDIRSQFALWLSSQPRKIFSSMSQAWDIFVQPKLKFEYPVILLPGSICNVCSSTKYRTKNFSKVGYEQCPQCKGTGRKRPRAISAKYDETSILSVLPTASPLPLESVSRTI